MFWWCYLWQIQFCSLAPSACRSRLTPAAGRRIPSVPTKPVHRTCRSRITLPDRAFSEIRSMVRFLPTHGWKKNCFWYLIHFMENCVRYTWFCCGSFSFSCIKSLPFSFVLYILSLLNCFPFFSKLAILSLTKYIFVKYGEKRTNMYI